MSVYRVTLAFVVSSVLLAAPVYASRVHRSPTSGAVHHSSRHHSTHPAPAHRLHGQQAIDPDRVTQIQDALIHAHYLTGEATGKWDASTVAAMQKYQADNGWQTKLTPDSRALVSLGLGPDYSGAINAKEAHFTPPPPISTIPPPQAEGFVQASGVDQ